MTSWTVDNPATLGFDEVTDLVVRQPGGPVAATGRLPVQTRTPAQVSLGITGRVRSKFGGAGSGNVGAMSGNVSVTSASGAITLLGRERAESETR